MAYRFLSSVLLLVPLVACGSSASSGSGAGGGASSSSTGTSSGTTSGTGSSSTGGTSSSSGSSAGDTCSPCQLTLQCTGPTDKCVFDPKATTEGFCAADGCTPTSCDPGLTCIDAVIADPGVSAMAPVCYPASGTCAADAG